MRKVADTSLLITAIVGAAAFAAGVAADWIKQWSAAWFARSEVRNAIRAELEPIIVSLNFYILKAIEALPSGRGIELSYFASQPQFPAFEYYWNQKRDALLKLPEWSRLQSWYGRLASIRQLPEPVLFSTIMLFESLLLPPLDKSVDRNVRVTIRNTLAREDVQAYKMDYLLRASGIKMH